MADVVSRDRRARMIALQLVARGIRDDRVLQAMFTVPRELFLPPEDRDAAYVDGPRSVACGQTISQPYIVARMLELVGVRPEDRVLEVGTGTGYQAALLGHLARQVVTIERHEVLAEQARRNLRELGMTHVEVRTGDGTLGAPDRAPFDGIVVAAAGPRIPPALLEQLAPGGRMICPVGDRHGQRLVRVVRSPDGHHDKMEELDAVMFVPLIGRHGWSAA